MEDIMHWLFTLHLRAPGSTVMLVANKCDRRVDDFAGIANKVEQQAAELLRDWQDNRGIQPTLHPTTSIDRGCTAAPEGASPAVWSVRRTEVTVLSEPNLVSCLADGSSPQACGLSALIDRVAAQAATAVRVPPAWGLALKVIDALREKRDPLRAARAHLGVGTTSPAPVESEGEGQVEDTSFMSRKAFVERWNGVVRSLDGELESPAEQMVVSSPNRALEGALWIRQGSGNTVACSSCIVPSRLDGLLGLALLSIYFTYTKYALKAHVLMHQPKSHTRKVGLRVQ